MKISVIIAVYNAEQFLENAVKSAMEQSETGEVILAEDGSSDNSLAICRKLAAEYDKVKLIENPKGVNQGGGITRNRGLQNATLDYVTFLDADDYYLSGRFASAKELFANNNDIDGVYEAVGTNSLDALSLERHLQRVSNSMGKADPMLTTMDIKCPPDQLFEVLLKGEHGFFHFNGLTLKRTVFKKVPFLDEVNPVLGIGNDKDLFFRLAADAILIPGKLNEPVAMRNVYEGNATLSMYTSNERIRQLTYCRYLQNSNLFRIMLRKQYSKEANRLVFRQHLEFYNEYYISQTSFVYRKFLKIINVLIALVKDPVLFSKII